MNNNENNIPLNYEDWVKETTEAFTCWTIYADIKISFQTSNNMDNVYTKWKSKTRYAYIITVWLQTC